MELNDTAESSIERDNLDWSPFFDSVETRFLVQRVYEAANSYSESVLFTAILRRAYEDALELEILYRELPRVMKGDRTAIESFRTLLDGVGGGHMDFLGGEPSWSELQRFIPHPNAPSQLPCTPKFLIKPPKIFSLVLGIELISHGDQLVYRRYLNTLLGLWEQATFLDHFFELAHEGIQEESDRLAETLRLMARNSYDHTRGMDLFSGDENLNPRREVFDIEYAWPPPDLGIPLRWPPTKLPSGVPDIPNNPCEFIKHACRRLVIDGIAELGKLPILTSTYATGITSISPVSACAGDRITINGSGFGAPKPANVNVLIGDKIAAIVSWSDTAIVIIVPANATSGCIGFRNETLEAERLEAYNRATQSVAGIGEGLACLGAGVPWPQPPSYTPSIPPCTPFNYFAGILPEIDYFDVNGLTSLVVEPNTPLTLTWSVRNATSIQIRRTSARGPAINVVNPVGNTLSLGSFTEKQPTDATYELEATNACGTVSLVVTVQLRKMPALKVLGVEIIQTIQRFSLTNPAQNNTVRLVANKRTVARVYVGSGITDGFSNGITPNEQGNVTGSVLIWPAGPSQGISAGSPLNNGGVFTARPASQIKRDDWTHTLNFELPWQHLSGSVTIFPEVWVQGHESEINSGWYAYGKNLTIDFQPRRKLRIVRMLIEDALLDPPPPVPNVPPKQYNNPPTLAEYETSLKGARTRFPIAEDGFIIIPFSPTLQTKQNLTFDNSWMALLLEILEIADDSDISTDIWSTVVPADDRYSLAGLRLPLNPIFVAQARAGFAFAHEMGHTFDVQHAPNQVGAKCLKQKYSLDPRLPPATEDIGVDVFKRSVVPRNTAEIMGYCTPTWSTTRDHQWISIALWNILFDALA